jgi:hypothetical protein
MLVILLNNRNSSWSILANVQKPVVAGDFAFLGRVGLSQNSVESKQL